MAARPGPQRGAEYGRSNACSRVLGYLVRYASMNASIIFGGTLWPMVMTLSPLDQYVFVFPAKIGRPCFMILLTASRSWITPWYPSRFLRSYRAHAAFGY